MTFFFPIGTNLRHLVIEEGLKRPSGVRFSMGAVDCVFLYLTENIFAIIVKI